MSFILIKGTFHVKGYSPDGDSIRFQAYKPANWQRLSGPAVELNARGHAQLRIEAIDALETHFKGLHQPLKFARPAANFLLSSLGIHEVVWDETQSIVFNADDGTEGCILARSTEANRRPVAFVFAGDIEYDDGADVVLSKNMLRESLNYKIIAKGLAYPTYYNGLFSDLRSELTSAMNGAKADGKGFWPYDQSNAGFSVTDLKTLTDQYVIFPKLFRRIVEYMGNGGQIDGFKDYLAKGCEPLIKISQVHFTRLDAVVEVEENFVRLAEAPENLVFLDKVLCKKAANRFA